MSMAKTVIRGAVGHAAELVSRERRVTKVASPVTGSVAVVAWSRTANHYARFWLVAQPACCNGYYCPLARPHGSSIPPARVTEEGQRGRYAPARHESGDVW